ncbi:MAG: DUF177 domain-containing protein [Demequinaceae bacterium]|nr:DUF177 domain-containing protein [Demequinaceae bacterium]
MVSVRDIARKPGAHKPHARTLPAPAVLGTEVIGVPEGSDLVLNLSLESVSEGIWVSGTVTAEAVGECARCLDEVTEQVVAPVQGLFVYPDARAGDSGDEADVYDFDGENLDLEEAIRDALVTALPFVPLCDPDCPGLCDQCGARLADDPKHHHDVVDPRWAALDALIDKEALTDKKEN